MVKCSAENGDSAIAGKDAGCDDGKDWRTRHGQRTTRATRGSGDPVLMVEAGGCATRERVLRFLLTLVASEGRSISSHVPLKCSHTAEHSSLQAHLQSCLNFFKSFVILNRLS